MGLNCGYAPIFIAFLALPRGPVTIATPKRDYSEGEEIWVNCTSPPADPPPKIQWYINNKIVSQNVIYIKFVVSVNFTL